MSVRILVVDDEVDVCDVLREVLSYEGFDTHIVQTGDAALKKLSESDYDVLLIDIRLDTPVSGIDVIKSLKNKAARPKILVMSATEKMTLEGLFEENGIRELVDRILEKPQDLSPERVGEKIKAIMGMRKS